MLKWGMPLTCPIVFLDFDGVLHPEGCASRHHGMHADALAQVLLKTDARVVVSSTWRLTRSISALKSSMGAALGSLVLGKTPVYSDLDLAQLPSKLHAYQRHTECVAWMRKHHANPDAWLALDDRPYIFYPFCPNLVVCNARTGLDGQNLDQLAARLVQMPG